MTIFNPSPDDPSPQIGLGLGFRREGGIDLGYREPEDMTKGRPWPAPHSRQLPLLRGAVISLKAISELNHLS